MLKTTRFRRVQCPFMALILILAFLCSQTLNAQGAVSDYSKTVTINETNSSLKSIFKIITKQTKLKFLGPSSILDLSEKHSIKVKNISVDKVLNELLKGKRLSWSIEDGIIIIQKGENESSTTSIASFPTDSLITVSGRVINKKEEPVIGATILIKGLRSGTTSGSDGSFLLRNIAPNASIIISGISFITKEVMVKGRTSLGDIGLTNFINDLDETIVLAYSTTTRRYSTGNVSTVKAKDIEKQNVTNPLLALQGRVPGLVIEQSSGFANAGVSVKIQGTNSLARGADPLYVIDGVPINSRLPSNLGNILGGAGLNGPDVANSGPGAGSPLSFINPADIESIDVLKDADATSIYGSRAAAGAILITTKKGKSGKTSLDLNIQKGTGVVGRKMNLLNTQQYLEMRKEAYTNDGKVIPNESTTPANSNYDLTRWNSNKYTDWQKELIGGTAQYTNINATLSGGNANTQYSLGAGYNKQTTVFPGDLDDQKGSLHFAINNTSADQKFKLQVSGNYMVDANNLIARDLTGLAMTIAPNAPDLYTKEGAINWEPLSNGNSTWTNPLAYLNGRLKINTNNLVASSALSYQILPSLILKSNFGYTNYQGNETQLSPLSIYRPEEQIFNERTTNIVANNTNSWIIEPQLNFKQSIWKGKLDALLGASLQHNNSTRSLTNASGFSTDLLMENMPSATSREILNGYAQYKYSAFFATLNYNILDKYILNFSVRRDGSSRFGPENRFHNFGSVAGAWIFSNEDFIKQHLLILSFGKVKASYGTTGNDQIGDYKYLSVYENVNGADVSYQNANGLVPNGIANPYLQWEQTRKLSVGIDLGFFADRILVNATYYRNRSSNQLLEYALPVVTGFDAIFENRNALVQNSGLELSLNVRIVNSNDFNWNMDINTTLNRNKLIDFPNLSTSTYATQYVIGLPISIQRVFNYAGVDPTTGLYTVTDKQGKPTNNPIPSFQPNTDATVLLDLTPKYYGGFRNTFTFKRLELDILFQYAKQKSQMVEKFGLSTIPGIFFGTSSLGNQPKWILDRWQKAGDIASIQRYSTDYRYFQNSNNAGLSNATYGDASYIRLKNISLSYELPIAWQQKFHLKNAKVFAQGQNVLTITSYKALDPETKTSSILPPLRIITAGINITL